MQLLILFIITYIEITIFIQVAHVIGILVTLLLMIFTSIIGLSLIRTQGLRIFIQIQRQIIQGENLARDMIKSLSILLAGFLLLLPGFITDFLGLLLLLPSVQNLLTLRLILYMKNKYFSGYYSKWNTFEGEFHQKNIRQDQLDNRYNKKE